MTSPDNRVDAVTPITIFVACPSDCDKYRSVVREAINDVNRLLGGILGVSVVYLGFDTSVAPGAAARAQEVINEQIGDRYDIFLGILALRFGTATGDFGSGTEEEFSRAFSRFKQSARPEIMVYRDHSPVDPTIIDADQFSKVTAFIRGIQKSGVLTGSFDNPEQFRRDLQAHIASKAKTIADRRSPTPTTDAIKLTHAQSVTGGEVSPPVVPPSAGGPSDALPSDEAEPPAILDLQVAADERMGTATQSLERLSSYMGDLGKNVTKRTDEINALVEQGRPVAARAAKSVMDAVSEELRSYSERSNAELPILRREFTAALDAGMQVLVLLAADDPEVAKPAIRRNRDALKGMENSLDNAIAGLKGFRDSLAKAPVLVSSIAGPKRRAVATADGVIKEILDIGKQCNDMLSLIDDMLKKL